jgi:hypothetical protein
VFFVWEAGLFETLRHDLGGILKDEVFQELVKKAGEWVLKQIGDGFTTRGGGMKMIDKYQVRRDFDAWFAGQKAEPPVPLETPTKKPGAVKAADPSEDDLALQIEAELELGDDDHFEQVMAGLYVASGRGTAAKTRSGSVPAANIKVLVDEKALDEMFPPQTPGNKKAILTWYKIAKFLARVVIAVVRRHWNKRDHGTYTTIVEEVLRAAYIDRVGEVAWRLMKKHTGDAFAADDTCVGTALFKQLAALAAQKKTFGKITLIGHSTGAVYINNFIEHAATALPDTKFNLILLAPASRSDAFSKVLAAHGGRIAAFRMFTMTDELESQDQLLSIIYPRSLLYFISGVLEGEPDVPLVGMNRFNADKDLFNATDFKDVADIRSWLAMKNSNCVWSIADGGAGLNSTARSHGDFDNDEVTLLSIEHVISNGY